MARGRNLYLSWFGIFLIKDTMRLATGFGLKDNI